LDGLDGFNQDGNETFAWLFGSSYANLLQIAPTKPIMITQTGSVETGKAAWITEALPTRCRRTFPQIKALVWFNWRIYENNAWLQLADRVVCELTDGVRNRDREPVLRGRVTAICRS